MKRAEATSHGIDAAKMSLIFSLPTEILTLLNTPRADRLTDYIMARICDKQCCDIKKAAFFVNNPDFDCCRGVIGYHANDLEGVAVHDESFDRIARAFDASGFNKSVKTFSSSALKKNTQEHIDLMAHAVGLENPTVF